jgi:hypothetical protein
MALFLADVPTAKIMILGHWSSNTFLAYICPKVLEWTSNMRRDMMCIDSFLDIGADPHTHSPEHSISMAPLLCFLTSTSDTDEL